MDTRHFRAFVAVFEERNITGAARRLHVSQPALSGTIKSLEDLLGTLLFERKARGVSVTEDARILYPQACRILSQTDALARQFRNGAGTSELEIGVDKDIAAQDIAAFIGLAREIVPLLFVKLVEGCDGEARLSTEDDCCEDEVFLELAIDPYVLAVPAGSAVNAALPWVVCPEHGTHQRLLPYYGAAANTPAANAASMRLALNLVAAGVGCCVAPQSLTRGVAGVVMRPTNGLQMMRRIGLCYSVQALDSSALRTLVARMGGGLLDEPAPR